MTITSVDVEQRQLSPAQLRGARGMLDWSRSQLAQAARLSTSTIKRMEMSEPQPVSDDAQALVRAALEATGLRFSVGCLEEGITRLLRR